MTIFPTLRYRSRFRSRFLSDVAERGDEERGEVAVARFLTLVDQGNAYGSLN